MTHAAGAAGAHPRSAALLASVLACFGTAVLAVDGLGLPGVGRSVAAAQPPAEAAPQRIGACSNATVVSKRFRMAVSPGDPGYKPSASPLGKEVLISLNNGIGLYAGDGDAFILSKDFAPGHAVTLCLLSLPQHCPPGDNRGKVYSLTDRQTRRTLRGIDSWHLCGGA